MGEKIVNKNNVIKKVKYIHDKNNEIMIDIE
jgi:hypothetical protein